MKSNRKYFRIALLGFVIWIVETAAFGFNQNAESGLEAFLDAISIVLIIYGILGDLLTNVEIHKNYYKYKETNIKTKTVQINGYSKAGDKTTARPLSIDKSLLEKPDEDRKV